MREPISTSVEIEEQVQLQCLPPPGLPIPEVFWLKDGKLINPKTQNNFIISNEGNLILTQARLSDMGNYTCGAQNVASKRLSEPARLTVYGTTSPPVPTTTPVPPVVDGSFGVWVLNGSDTGDKRVSLYNGATYALSPPYPRKALHLTSAAYATINRAEIWNKDFTISVYMKSTSRNWQYRTIVGSWRSGKWLFLLRINQDNQIQFVLRRNKYNYGSDPRQDMLNLSGGIVELNRWYSVAATWQRETGEAKIYLNGVEVATGRTRYPDRDLERESSPDFQIGYKADSGPGRFHFEGYIGSLTIQPFAIDFDTLLKRNSGGPPGKPTVSVMTLPLNSSLEVGRTMILKCETAKFDLGTHYAWYKDGALVYPLFTPMLFVVNVKMEDAGQYKCSAMNVYGEFVSDAMDIVINVPIPTTPPPPVPTPRPGPTAPPGFELDNYSHRFGDCFGNDIKQIRYSTLPTCERECNKLVNCKSFLFVNSGWRSYCWLKYSECQTLTQTSITKYHFYNKIVQTTPVPPTPETSETGVPEALLNCTMKTMDDARVLARNMLDPDTKINDPIECMKKCQDNIFCNKASFNNRTKKCTNHPRSAFSMGYITNENHCCISFIKECPMMKRKVPDEQILCPMDHGRVRQPSMEFAYREMRYQKTSDEAEYSCRTDPLCAAISFSLNKYNKMHFVFYYKTTPAAGAPFSNSTAIKNCTRNTQYCGLVKALKNKSLKNAHPYSKRTNLRRKSSCLAACERDTQCHAVTYISFVEHACKLYRIRRGGDEMESFPGYGSAMTWIKDPRLCVGSGGDYSS